jgi:ActR/RegA family two-component response regulator
MNRSLDRGDIKDLGDVMDTGEIAVVALTYADSVTALDQVRTGATNKITRSSSTADEVHEALADAERGQ